MTELVMALIVVVAVYSIFIDPTQSIFLSRRDRMANMREQNRRKGIHMRPNWKYIDPDTKTRYMSKTGRLEDSKDLSTGKHFVPEWYTG